MNVDGDLSVVLDDEREGIVNVLATWRIYVEGWGVQKGLFSGPSSRKECGWQQALLPRIRRGMGHERCLLGSKVTTGAEDGPTGATGTIRLFVPGLVVNNGEHILFGFVGRTDIKWGI